MNQPWASWKDVHERKCCENQSWIAQHLKFVCFIQYLQLGWTNICLCHMVSCFSRNDLKHVYRSNTNCTSWYFGDYNVLLFVPKATLETCGRNQRDLLGLLPSFWLSCVWLYSLLKMKWDWNTHVLGLQLQLSCVILQLGSNLQQDSVWVASFTTIIWQNI